jgi:D-alanyl-D-alanine carboxypeptidase/D-alanyl-D-alanine-endopeptidase (penicillin-binding protein 4)
MQQLASSAICWTTMAAACGLAFAQTPRQAVPVAGTPPSATQSVAAQPLAAQSLGNQIAAMVAEPTVARAHWGVIVTALDGTPIYALNEGQLFQPDSNAKLFTTAAAMAILGPGQTFRTQLIAMGTLMNGVLTGDLELVGRGDANLSGRVLPYVSPAKRPEDAVPAPDPLQYLAQFADTVVAKGIKVVNGDVVGDDTHFAWEPYPTDWAVDDLVWGYGAPVSALSINDNQIEMTITSGTKQGGKAAISIKPDIPYYTIDNEVWTALGGLPSPVAIEREPGSKTVKVRGGMNSGEAAHVEELAIEDPAEYVAMALKGLLKARGVVVTGTARAKHWSSGEELDGFLESTRKPLPWLDQYWKDEGSAGSLLDEDCTGTKPVGYGDSRPSLVLATRTSVTLADDVVLTNKISQNLHAEILLRNLGFVGNCWGSIRNGAQIEHAFLLHAGLDKDDFVFYDGSGLSGHDLVTPRATAKLLSYAAHDPRTGAPQPWFADWKASLPIGGVDGTLDYRFTKPPLKGHVFAKTGTHSEGNALSGYLDCASGRTVIFSIFVDHHLPGDTAPRVVIDRIVATIAAAE